MKNGILYIGNRLSSKNKNPTTHENLATELRNFGHKVFSASSLENKYLRLSHMLVCFLRYLGRYKYVLIDTYSTQNFWYAVILARFSKHFNKKYILILHGGNLENRIKNSRATSDFLLKNAHRIISPSLYLKEKLLEYGYSEVIYIPNPFYPDNYNFKPRVSIQPKLLWVRAFDEIYNPLLGLKSLKTLLQEYPNSQLCMIGPKKGAAFKNCKEYADQHKLPVTFTGKLSKKEWATISKDYDIFLNTTTVDNVPVSVLEAMALGLCVISTKVGGIPYIVKEGESGLMVPSNSPEEMAQAVKKLLENKPLAEEISRNARKNVQQLDWKYFKPLWEKLLA